MVSYEEAGRLLQVLSRGQMPKPDGFLRKLLEREELHSAPSALGFVIPLCKRFIYFRLRR
jgi:hypothetical protein